MNMMQGVYRKFGARQFGIIGMRTEARDDGAAVQAAPAVVGPFSAVEAIAGVAERRADDAEAMEALQALTVMPAEPAGLGDVARELQHLEMSIQQCVAEIVHLTR